MNKSKKYAAHYVRSQREESKSQNRMIRIILTKSDNN